ncbi:MAG: hypothetical protein JNJ57_21155 [Saprospiraceae bacterium]|nr:hypothetical protein [Saprospiraceae bacterium]
MRYFLLGGITLFFFTITGKKDIFSDAKQLVVVVSPSKTSVGARLWKFERHGNIWAPVGEPHEVNLGKKGLAWGRGLHSAKPGLQKKEGDQKSPAGIFRFGDAFGYAAEAGFPIKLRYLPITETAICVEDPNSRYYNQVMDAASVTPDWKARESMLRQDEQYKWGIIVKHNLPAKAAGGSCIFFHLWRAPGSGTLGCTAMSEENLLSLLQWLNPAQKPLLMQMTTADYDSYRKKVALPKVDY